MSKPTATKRIPAARETDGIKVDAKSNNKHAGKQNDRNGAKDKSAKHQPRKFETRMINMVESINQAMAEAMRADENVLVMGEDVGVDGGVFRATDQLIEEFGPDRCIDTPLAEGAIIGTAVGLCLYGLKPICEMQFSGFAYQAFHQVENHVSRMHNRSRGKYNMQMVIRMPYGGGIRAIEHHSESREAYYVHTPGLKMVVCSTPRNARALLHSAIHCPDPVIFYEPKASYRAFREEVPVEIETMEIGKANIAREGKDITLIAYGAMMRPTLEAAEDLADEHGVSAEVIDLISLKPMDTETIVNSVCKTGRAVVIHEGPRACGIGAEVIARINENALDHLCAPVKRLTGFDTQFPFFAREQAFLPSAERIVNVTKDVLSYD
jgi:pyruvate dehydrogenase E1 component beta subunit